MGRADHRAREGKGVDDVDANVRRWLLPRVARRSDADARDGVVALRDADRAAGMRPMERTLDAEQLAAVQAPERLIRVQASAGSGKTLCLTRRVVHLV